MKPVLPLLAIIGSASRQSPYSSLSSHIHSGENEVPLRTKLPLAGITFP